MIPQAIIEKLRHPAPNKRSEAVFALDKLDDSGKLPLLVDALRMEQDLYVREDITYAIMQMGEQAVPSLIDLLQNKDAQVRHHAVHTLGKIAHPTSVAALIDALHDPDPVVVMKACVALRQTGNSKAVPALVRLLEHDDPEVQTSLINTLEHFGDAAVPLLLRALEHERWQVRERAADILGIIGKQEIVPALSRALADDHWQVRFAAVMALGHLEGQAAKNALQQVQNDPDPRVSTLGTRMLGQL